ncbi:hypothetical protein JHN59_37120 [Streptomyces sp. MBT49]|uniref:hypothetical protein n=1 Tax=unclassified Streptomyces TaxID=2593676 RepID=UPI00190E5521|nr:MULTISPECIES: hypothetical protein [unclassified Streptomyces]MBK3630323.1 hypothetical protein [Streptomyces sp. MBT49]MBK3634710.1 hypothetical protein [Streptomyces sp. MBT97]
MTAKNTPQDQGQAARVAELQREARESYRGGAQAREGLDRAEARRRESWGS